MKERINPFTYYLSEFKYYCGFYYTLLIFQCYFSSIFAFSGAILLLETSSKLLYLPEQFMIAKSYLIK